MTNSRARKNNFASIVCPLDQTVNNTTTLVNSTYLTFIPTSGKQYAFQLTLNINSSSVADFKFSLDLPSGASGSWSTVDLSSATLMAIASVATDITIQMGGAQKMLIIQGFLSISTTITPVTLQFAQGTAEVSTTYLTKGSSLIVWES